MICKVPVWVRTTFKESRFGFFYFSFAFIIEYVFLRYLNVMKLKRTSEFLKTHEKRRTPQELFFPWLQTMIRDVVSSEIDFHAALRPVLLKGCVRYLQWGTKHILRHDIICHNDVPDSKPFVYSAVVFCEENPPPPCTDNRGIIVTKVQIQK